MSLKYIQTHFVFSHFRASSPINFSLNFAFLAQRERWHRLKENNCQIGWCYLSTTEIPRCLSGKERPDNKQDFWFFISKQNAHFHCYSANSMQIFSLLIELRFSWNRSNYPWDVLPLFNRIGFRIGHFSTFSSASSDGFCLL